MKQSEQSRRTFIKTAAAGSAALALSGFMSCADGKKPPNFVLIFCDDLGYGDLGSFGHPTIRTPNLDRMAVEGQRWTQFYAAAPVCTPSRAALMTGRYPVRSGMCSDKRGVLFPDSAGGLPETEITIATALKSKSYATACVGKWHLGHLPQYLPTSHGFDSYFGIPYSNDMDKIRHMSVKDEMDPKPEYYNVPLMRNEEVIERPAKQGEITKRYTEEAVQFIQTNKDQPFFLYLAHTMPHIPLFRSKQFKGTSRRGYYGDVIEEIDWSVGEIVRTLKKEGLDENTLVVFTSDNGPWLLFDQHGGSAGPLRNGKGTTFEGGMREPTIFWWPGKIQPGVEMGIGCTMDVMPTFCVLAGADMPDDREIDGKDLSGTLFKGKESPREEMIYYRGQRVYAARKGPYKAHFMTELSYQRDNQFKLHDPPLLFNIEEDPSEKYNIAADYPKVIKEIQKMVEQHRKTLGPPSDNLVERIKEGPAVL
ncbi:sulfatase [candidate division KSB1 bacterium]|nr:sulfatase [candidate division KSB1 bacterium]